MTTERDFAGRAGLAIAEGPPVDDPAGGWAHTMDAVQQILDDPARASTEIDGSAGSSTLTATLRP